MHPYATSAVQRLPWLPMHHLTFEYTLSCCPWDELRPSQLVSLQRACFKKVFLEAFASNIQMMGEDGKVMESQHVTSACKA